jgi:hypothetical protein
MPPPKEPFSRYIKLSRLGKLGTKKSSTNLQQGTIYEAQQDYSRDARENQTHRKKIKIS